MTVALTKVTGANHVSGNKKVRVFNYVLSSNYATGGEALTAATLGLKAVDTVTFDGPAYSTDRATAIQLKYDYTNSKIVAFESGADGVALAEKTNSEAYPTGCHGRLTATGH